MGDLPGSRAIVYAYDAVWVIGALAYPGWLQMHVLVVRICLKFMSQDTDPSAHLFGWIDCAIPIMTEQLPKLAPSSIRRLPA